VRGGREIVRVGGIRPSSGVQARPPPLGGTGAARSLQPQCVGLGLQSFSCVAMTLASYFTKSGGVHSARRVNSAGNCEEELPAALGLTVARARPGKTWHGGIGSANKGRSSRA
jgi:hypothetical protein